MQEISENLGVGVFSKKLREDDAIKPFLGGIFPRDSVANARFSINFFTSIGLGEITEDLREFVKDAPKILLEQKYAELLAQAQAEEDSDSSSDSSSSSSSSSGSSRSSGSASSRSQSQISKRS